MIGVCDVWNGYFGNTWYWDPYNGSDGNGGTSVIDAVATFGKAQSLVTSGNYDIIVCYPGNPSGPTIADEIINITKKRLTLYGPGSEFRIQPTSSADHSITISANNVKIRGIDVLAPVTGSVDAIHIDGYDSAVLEDLRVKQGSRYGLYIANSQQSRLYYFHVNNVAGHGIYVDDSIEILDCVCCTVRECGGDGVSLRGTGIDNVRLQNECTQISSNSGYGIYIGTGAAHTILDQSITLSNNSTGDLLDEGVDTLYSGLDQAAAFGGAVHIDVDNGISGTNYPRGTQGTPVDNIGDARIIADRIKVKTIAFKGTVTLDQSYAGWSFVGSDPEADTLRLSNEQVNKSSFELLTLTGNQKGTIYCKECIIDNVTDGDGTYANCRFIDSFTLSEAGSSAILINCHALTPTTIDLVGIDRELSTAGLTGKWTLKNLVISDPPLSVRMEFETGELTVDSTCVSGSLDIAGTVNTIDRSGVSCTVRREAQIQASPGEYQGSVWLNTLGEGKPGTEYPIGTPSEPVDNMEDALVIADRIGLSALDFRGPTTLIRDMKGWNFKGYGSITADVINLGGYDVSNSRFELLTITGTMKGSNPTLYDCFINNVTGFAALGKSVFFVGTITMGPPGSIVWLIDAVSSGTPSAPVVIDMVGPGRAFRMGDSVGEFKFLNAADGAPFPTNITAGISLGGIVIDSSCTGGHLTVRGIISPTLNGNMTQIYDTTLESLHGEGSWQGGANVDARTELMDKLIKNRLELADGVGYNWVLYDDDNETELLKWPARDKDGLPIVQPVGAPSRRGKAIAGP
jgi:hypothetical protein